MTDAISTAQLRAIPANSRSKAHIRGRIRVGFLYNHDQLHQVAHTAPIIAELQRQHPAFEIEVLAGDAAQATAAERHFDPALPKPRIHLLRSRYMPDLVEKLSGRALPIGRIGRLEANLELLASYDALVVPETTSTLLKTRFGLTGTRLIFYPHGAGDRSISISPDIAKFDFVLLPGEKTRDRMAAAGIVREGKHALVGYPKFDVLGSNQPTKLFDNGRPTVVYNPHFDPVLSSWFDCGLGVLDYFAQQSEYNLVVAPHVMLFQRRILASTEHRKLRFRREIPEKYFGFDHIRIDTGSTASVDMTYTNGADIYLGDVSSQIYEFIHQPRPAIFLNSHEARWQDDPNYAFWNFGPVIDHVGGLEAAVDVALPLTDHYRKIQSEAFRETFGIDENRSSSSRAATAIADYLLGYIGSGHVDD